MKAEFRKIPPPEPPPPTREVVITVSVADAKALHNELYKLTRADGDAKHYTVNRLVQALTEARVQCA